MKSLTNAIMMDATKASETIPNLDAKLSFLPYKFCKDGPAPDKARPFSCMPLCMTVSYTRMYQYLSMLVR
jgi:hypothetical protein